MFRVVCLNISLPLGFSAHPNLKGQAPQAIPIQFFIARLFLPELEILNLVLSIAVVFLLNSVIITYLPVYISCLFSFPIVWRGYCHGTYLISVCDMKVIPSLIV
jgi:hypothetical protein